MVFFSYYLIVKHMKNKYKKNLLIISLILCLVLSVFSLKWINKRISPILFNYAENEITKLSTIIINRAVNKQLANGMNLDELFHVVQNGNGEIQTIDFNPSIVNRVLNTTTNVILINLKAIEEGNINFIELPDIFIEEDNLKKGIIYELPIGTITNNILLSNLGVKVPIKLNIIGSVESNIKTNIKEYGINNALLEVFVQIKVDELVNVPFISKKVTVTTNIPIAIKVVQGIVPKYYGGNLSKESNILSIPIE